MTSTGWIGAAIAATIFFSGILSATVLKAPGKDAKILQLRHEPRRGMTKQQVKSHFGQPVTRRGPVGQPPIYRWDYNRYSVFFEGNRVLHTVVPLADVRQSE